ncbi:MAG: winged helix-turn-helix transcriptional regulator [Thermoproteales archaeon]|nr:winged helix-turn-helix transcriptional regulator [Thermoproteales archaeon]
MSLEERVEELRRMVEQLAEEVKKLKEAVKPKPERRAPPESLSEYAQLVLKFLEEKVGSKPDAGIVFIGGLEKRGGKIVDSFFSSINLGAVRKTRPGRIVRTLGPLTNENRVKILLSLLEGPKTASELAQETGLEGGPLYHHLKELMLAGYVDSPERGKYVLTSGGCMVIRVAAALAATPGLTPPQVEEQPVA